jgi:hypothetical protein
MYKTRHTYTVLVEKFLIQRPLDVRKLVVVVSGSLSMGYCANEMNKYVTLGRNRYELGPSGKHNACTCTCEWPDAANSIGFSGGRCKKETVRGNWRQTQPSIVWTDVILAKLLQVFGRIAVPTPCPITCTRAHHHKHKLCDNKNTSLSTLKLYVRV